MSIMKKIYPTLMVFHLACAAAFAQQEPMQTQFFFNKMVHNPGYAGSAATAEIVGAYRNQWMGVKGAPKYQTLSYNRPIFNDKVGIGANLSHLSIAITRVITLDLAYAYRIPTRKGILGIGVQAGARHFSQNWNDSRIITDVPRNSDGSIPVDANSKVVANFGAGFYYYNDQWYAGVAGQRLYGNNIDFADTGEPFSRESLHLNAMAGSSFKLSEDLKLTPQILLKYVPNAPFDADINAGLWLKEKFYGALTYRTGSGTTSAAGESVDVLMGMQATEQLFFCLSYDIGLTPLRKYNNGTIEATVRYWVNPPASESAPTVPTFLPTKEKPSQKKGKKKKG